MPDKLQLEIITPKKKVASEEVDDVVAPGVKGVFGVLPGHLPFVTLISPGVLKYTADGKETSILVWRGVVDVRDDIVKVMTDNVENIEEIDKEEAKIELEALNEEIKSFDGSPKELRELRNKQILAEVRASL